MTDSAHNNRLPLIIAVLALVLLGGISAWLLLGSKAATADNEQASMASANAEKAVTAAGMSTKDRAATEAVVRAYILENPEIITDAIAILQKRDMTKRLSAAGPRLTKAFPGAETGNPNGDVTIVEFSDYSCGFCRASVADVNRLVGEDKGIRLIYRELPILSPQSQEAALWGLAAAKQGKHKAFHDAMFAIGRPSPEAIRAAAARAGVNIAQAEAFAKSAEAKAEIESNLAIMQQIGFNGTPTFVIGDQMLEGALGYDALKAAVAKARKS